MASLSPELIPVASFTKATTPIETQLEYPGSRPEGSFMTDGRSVELLPDGYDDFVEQADERLRAAHLPLIEDRIPVLAYGSNASPDRLRTKIAKYGTTPELMTVPHCAAEMPNTLAVWHGQPGQVGSMFAELYTQAEARGASLQAHVAFLTKQQLAIIHSTEGKTYSAAELPVKVGRGKEDTVVPVLAYIALDSQILLKDEKPVLVASLQHTNTALPAMDAGEAVDYILGVTANAAGVEDTVDAYIGEGIKLTLAGRKERQGRVGQQLAELGLQRKFKFIEDAPERLIGRADFASIPGNHDKHLYTIPHMELADMRASAEAVDAKMAALKRKPAETDAELRARAMRAVDLATIVSGRALEELSVRTGQKIIEK